MREWPPHSADIVLSASDLTRFQACAHATSLDLRAVRGEPLMPAEDDGSARLLQEKGNAHELAYLGQLREAGRSVVTVEREADLDVAAARTAEALRRGPDIVYQAALRTGTWSGYADFLERTAGASGFGDFSYEVVDTKLKRSPAPAHLLQLCLYADLLGDLQGQIPERVHVVLGDGRRESFLTRDFSAYARRLRARLGEFVAQPSPTRPEPVTACNLCRWQDRCDAEWESSDSLVLVAGIRRSQRDRLEAAGIATMAALAVGDSPVSRLDRDILAGLRQQARLQTARRRGGSPHVELRPVRSGLGLEQLPRPSPGDLFFDMEGDPLIEGGLEYLFGIHDEVSGRSRFQAVWAHSREQEPVALQEVLRLFDEALRRYPDAHIYHYNHYEVTALKRLASRDGIGEGALDRLLREKRFVDLYRVVQQGIRTSEPGYSLKDLEVFFAEKRGEGVANAADSVVAYERYRQSGDAAILEDIRQYNETDCRSTQGLRDWLLGLRPVGMPWRAPVEAGAMADAEEVDKLEAERRRLKEILAPVRARLGEDATDLLFELAFFHQREDKPAWWAIFDRQGRESIDLIEDLECVAGLTAHGTPRPVKRSKVQDYRFPAQETKLRADSAASGQTREGAAGERRTVEIVSLDPAAGTAELKFGPGWREIPARLDLVPGDPFKKNAQKAAIARVIADVAASGTRYPAIVDLLMRTVPRVQGMSPGRPLVEDGADLIEVTTRVVSRLEKSCLPIQGPPGTGKTYVSARVILHLLRAGKRVGVASNAHKAIDNLMVAVAKHAREQGFLLDAVKKESSVTDPIDPSIATITDNKDQRLATASLVGGTAWLFAREEHDQEFDYLFVDEAGQVALANIVAMGAAARNLVLVGDPMQLGQPIQGVHPGESGLSALEYLLAGHQTVQPDRGIFFPESRRLHPAISRFVSELAYEGRLRSVAGTEQQALVLRGADPRLATSGIVFVEVAHEGRSQSSPEEAGVIRDLYVDLLRQGFRDRDGLIRSLTPADILVVAPYNAHVNLLQGVLPAGARVGTVDRFQGQEAPVSLLSLATSSAQEMPRDMDFLFSRNRLNVALSRAQALAVVVASPRLLDIPCSNLQQMRLVNDFCRLKEYADGLRCHGAGA